MIILNNGTSIFHAGVRRAPTPADSSGPVDQVRLMIGANEVNDEDWEAAKKLPVVQHHITEGTFVEQDSRPIAKRSEKLAIALVRKTFDSDLLARWHQDDERPGVRKAISDQLRECTLSADDKKMLEGKEE